jgi:multidrug efflux pump subunit AcrB
MNLTQFSVKNYAFTLVLFLMVAVVGVTTLLTMPRAEDPQINPPTYPIVVVYPGTSPADMEELVVKPIENKLYELDNIDKLVTSIDDGLAIVRVEFKYGEDIDAKYQEVIREMNALRSSLPADITSIDIRKVDPSDVNILQLALVSETASYRELRKKAEELQERLEKVGSLKKVKVSGAPEQEVRISLRTDLLAEKNIPLNAVIGSLQSEAVNIPGGAITAGTKSFNVKTSGPFVDLDDIAGTVVYQARGELVHLRDIADLQLQDQEQKHITRLNGKRAVLVHAAQKVGSNIANTQQQYQPILDAFEKSLPATMRLYAHFDQADNVARRLKGLGTDFAIAIVLVLFTLLPLGTRASLIVMVAIPLSLALGLVGLNAFGYSLNQLSIVGLVVALGLLVDDSIVVVENIERWLREGHSRKEAAIKATKQITLAVLGCTATLVIAFLPLIFLPGGPGEFIRSLPMAIISSVLASMVVSLTVVPFLASRVLKEHQQAEGNIFLQLLQKGISATYTRLMHYALARPGATLLVAGGLFVGSVALFPVIGFKLFPASEKPIFLVNVQLPQQSNLRYADEVSRSIEAELDSVADIDWYTTNVGRGNPQIYYNVTQQEEKSDFVQYFVQLEAGSSPTRKKEVIDQLRQRFNRFATARIEVKDFEQGPPIEAPIAIRIYGDQLDSLRAWSFRVESLLRKQPGTIYLNNPLNTLKTDLKLVINRDKARSLGVLTSDIDRTVRLAVAGLPVATLSDDDGNDYPVVLGTPRSQQQASLEAFSGLRVTNMQGIALPLQQLASLELESSPTRISHFNKRRFVQVTAYTRQGVLANDVLAGLVPELDHLNFPEGYGYQLAGEAESEGDAFGGGFATVILLTVFLFVAVLILQFRTFKGILIVLSVIPLGVIGGVTLLWLSGNPMSFIAILGFIGLAGIEVKNSILLVDFTNQLRSDGMALQEAIEKAGELRFLPVVLTSLTAIGGLIPLAFNPNPQISPLALVLIGGLISSTVLSRIVTPVMYKLIPPAIEPKTQTQIQSV